MHFSVGNTAQSHDRDERNPRLFLRKFCLGSDLTKHQRLTFYHHVSRADQPPRNSTSTLSPDTQSLFPHLAVSTCTPRYPHPSQTARNDKTLSQRPCNASSGRTTEASLCSQGSHMGVCSHCGRRRRKSAPRGLGRRYGKLKNAQDLEDRVGELVLTTDVCIGLCGVLA